MVVVIVCPTCRVRLNPGDERGAPFVCRACGACACATCLDPRSAVEADRRSQGVVAQPARGEKTCGPANRYGALVC